MNAEYKKNEDIATADWVEKYVPEKLRPYVRLTRIERKFDLWTLVLPSWFGCLLARADLKTWLIMTLGSILMLGIGCTYNDIIDRHIDRQTLRAQKRPLPSGAISVRAAWLFLGGQFLLAGLLFLLLNPLSKGVALFAIPLCLLYPFMKRITFFPHLFLGLCLNFGAFLSWTQMHGSLSASAGLLYIGCVFWTAGYDASYGLQDKEDDAQNGVLSAPLKLGNKIKIYLYSVYIAMLVFTLMGADGEMNFLFFILYPFAWALLPWQVFKLNLHTLGEGFDLFHNNRLIGFFLLLVFLIGII